MNKFSAKFPIISGAACVLLMAASTWYSITFNDSRFVKPFDLSEYEFQMQDLPMIISGILTAFYILYLFVLLAKAVIANKRKEASAQFTRKINPKLGFLGFLGFMGFRGFQTYSACKDISPFLCFIFFGFFGFSYEGKMSNTFIDERYKENRLKAHSAADKTALSIIFIATLFLGHGSLAGNYDFPIITYIIIVDLALALNVFLGEYLLYRYDHDEQSEESVE